MSIGDTIIFDDKTLSDMFSDVYENTERKRKQTNELIASLVKLIRTPEDAAMLSPIITDCLEVNVKNDEHIVRLVQIAQRIAGANTKSDTGDFFLSEEEKEQLLANVKQELEEVTKDQEELQDNIDNLKSEKDA